ncbi:hypothetical protein [Mucilaginibacter terrae]|uniref:hypothetical protein n=1 Tax=Mucilaginibacter terrae TaxID=1955052 RepID=UPI00366A5EB7
MMLIFSACDNKPKNQEAKQSAPVAVPAPVQKATGKLVGVWYDELIKSDKGEQIAYVVISKDKQFFIQAIAFPGTKLVVSDVPEIDPSATELTKTTNGYVNINNNAELYKVDKAGNLLIYDQGELVMTCKKVM